MGIMEVVSGNVRAYREAAGLTQAAAAEAAGMHFTAWCRIELGKSKGMTLATLEKVAKALGVTPAELVAPARKPRRG